MLNILFISSWYPTRIHHTNGDFVQWHSFAAAKYARVAVLHICFDINNTKKLEKVSREKENWRELIYYLKEPRIKFSCISAIYKAYLYVFYYWKGLKDLRKEYGFEPTLVHANVIYPIAGIAYMYWKLKKIPFVISEHWTSYLKLKEDHLSSWKLKFSAYIAKKAHKILPVSRHLQENMESFGIKGNYKVIGNVVNTDAFCIATPSIPEKPFRFVHVSSGTEAHKNVKGIVQAAEALRKEREDFELHLICRYPEKDQSNIFFYKKMPHNEVVNFIKNAHCLIQFSNYETFSIVLAESLSCGNPVISSKCGGLSEVLSPEYGIIIPLGNISALKKAMSQMIDSYSSFNKSKLRAYVGDRFSEESIAKQLQEVYLSAKP